MSLAAGIVSALVLLLTMLWWFIRRQADPAHENQQRHEQAEQDVGRHDGVASSVHGVADLDELDRVRRAQTPRD